MKAKKKESDTQLKKVRFEDDKPKELPKGTKETKKDDPDFDSDFD